MLYRQRGIHPAHAQPARAFLYRSTVLLTNMGYPWLVCTPLAHIAPSVIVILVMFCK